MVVWLDLQTVSKNKKYSHPIHWAGYMLIGRDILFKDKMVEMAASFRDMMHVSEDYLIAALKIMQGMVSNLFLGELHLDS